MEVECCARHWRDCKRRPRRSSRTTNRSRRRSGGLPPLKCDRCGSYETPENALSALCRPYPSPTPQTASLPGRGIAPGRPTVDVPLSQPLEAPPMPRISIPTSRPIIASLAVCLGALLGGAGAIASTQTSTSVIHGCYATRTGVLRRIPATKHCKTGEKSLNWNGKGIQVSPEPTAQTARQASRGHLGLPSSYEQRIATSPSVGSLACPHSTRTGRRRPRPSDHPAGHKPRMRSTPSPDRSPTH